MLNAYYFEHDIYVGTVLRTLIIRRTANKLRSRNLCRFCVFLVSSQRWKYKLQGNWKRSNFRKRYYPISAARCNKMAQIHTNKLQYGICPTFLFHFDEYRYPIWSRLFLSPLGKQFCSLHPQLSIYDRQVLLIPLSQTGKRILSVFYHSI